MKVVIMAGGKGTRISSIASDIPKPMIQIEGKPVLLREIECLREQGFKDIIITVSHLGNIIIDYFGDGSKFGVNIEYYFEKEPLGNAGALFKIKDKLSDEFLLLNADALFDIDFNRFIKYHHELGGLVTLFTHPNSHPYDSGLIIADSDLSVKKWLSKEDTRPEYYKNRVNAGLHVINKKVLDIEINTPKVDLDRQILKPLQGTHKMFVYDSPEYVKDMGTPERYYQVSLDCKNNLPSIRNLSHKQKAIFLDRDGTINQLKGFLTDINDFKLIEGVSEAIKLINVSKYLCIVITNQPVIARGEVSIEELNEIHNKMETLLGLDGAYINDIFYCPHHPDKGFIGERIEYKIECDCRKPKPGMLIEASKKYNIDLNSSWMIGDSKNDILCGMNALCKTALITQKEESYGETIKGNSLIEIVKNILGGH